MPPKLKLVVVAGILKWLMMAADMLGVGLLQQKKHTQITVQHKKVLLKVHVAKGRCSNTTRLQGSSWAQGGAG